MAAKLDFSFQSHRLADTYTWDLSVPRGSWARHVMPWGCLDLDMDGTSIMGFPYSHRQSPADCSAPLHSFRRQKNATKIEGSFDLLHALLAVSKMQTQASQQHGSSLS